ncbi:hypothetical protein LTR49_024916 [Elasticomyces elasticus]|nr:hypothetical protein LTR49_024916 [Elasticomyces elasticus]
MLLTLSVLGTFGGLSVVLARCMLDQSRYMAATATTFCVTFILCWLAWVGIVYPRFFSPLRALPEPPHGHFFTGHTGSVLSETSGFPQRRWTETIPNNGLIRYRHFFQEMVLLTDINTLSEVLVTKNYDFVKPKQLRRGLGQILGIGLLLSEDEEHRIQRKNLMPAFSYRHIKDLYPVFWTKAGQLGDPSGSTMDVKNVPHPFDQEEPAGIDITEWLSRATLDIIGLGGMGYDFDALHNPENQLNRTYRGLFNPTKTVRFLQVAGLFLPSWLLRWLPLKRNEDVRKASQYIKQVCRDVIAEKRRTLSVQVQDAGSVDIVSVGLESGCFTDEDLVNHMMTFLIAGQETTATAMIWACYAMCRYPEAQQKVRDDVRFNVPAGLHGDVTAAQIDKCHYLQAFCLEVLRLWTPVSLTVRVAAHETTIGHQLIPEGTTIVIAPWATNTLSSLWGPDSLQFKPGRWLNADGKANNKGSAESNFSFLTFLHGPRACIGQQFARAEFACLLAAWVGSFETTFAECCLRMKDEEVPEIKAGLTMRPQAGMWVVLRWIGEE